MAHHIFPSVLKDWRRYLKRFFLPIINFIYYYIEIKSFRTFPFDTFNSVLAMNASLAYTSVLVVYCMCIPCC